MTYPAYRLLYESRYDNTIHAGMRPAIRPSIDLSPSESIDRRWRLPTVPESPDLTKGTFRIYYNIYT